MPLTVVDPGPLTLVQDLGRVGHAAWGVPSGGAADRGAHGLANRLVGNGEDAATFELLLGPAEFAIDEATVVAVAGAAGAVTIDGRTAGTFAPLAVRTGARLRVEVAAWGLRAYLAVRGGLATAPVLGSRSVDERSGLGWRSVRGEEIAIGGAAGGPVPAVDLAPQAARSSGPRTLRGVYGPRSDWLTSSALATLGRAPYRIGSDSDRVGTRLAGPALEHAVERELLSEPTIRGAVEVPADGAPIVFGPDHPTTCGYPVVAVLDPDSADVLAQCRPGQEVTFALRRPRVELTTSGRRRFDPPPPAITG